MGEELYEKHVKCEILSLHQTLEIHWDGGLALEQTPIVVKGLKQQYENAVLLSGPAWNLADWIMINFYADNGVALLYDNDQKLIWVWVCDILSKRFNGYPIARSKNGES